MRSLLTIIALFVCSISYAVTPEEAATQLSTVETSKSSADSGKGEALVADWDAFTAKAIAYTKNQNYKTNFNPNGDIFAEAMWSAGNAEFLDADNYLASGNGFLSQANDYRTIANTKFVEEDYDASYANSDLAMGKYGLAIIAFSNAKGRYNDAKSTYETMSNYLDLLMAGSP